MNNRHTRRLTWLLFFGQSLNSAAYIAGTTIGAIIGAALSGQPALAGLPSASFGRVRTIVAGAIALALGRAIAPSALETSAIGLAIGLPPLWLAIQHLARRASQPSLASG
jgi:hypothetical protein